MPAVWKHFESAEFWIIGSNPPPELRLLAERDSRVRVTGFVERVQDVLRTAAVMLCPFTGTYGFRSRVIEAMALGVPVVATQDAIYGMDLAPDQGLLLAETDEAMGLATLRLLTDPAFAAAQSCAARAQIEQRYSFQNCYDRLGRELLHFATRRRAGREPEPGLAAIAVATQEGATR